MKAPDHSLWVFAYGSLLWSPEFDYEQAEKALIHGYRRSFCMWSIHYRGTREMPGLVLSLERAPKAQCAGVAFRIANSKRQEALAALRKRELIGSAYEECFVHVHCANGQKIKALTYIINPNHAQYCGSLALENQAAIIARARGTRGENSQYLYQTKARLDGLGIADEQITQLSQMVDDLLAG